MNTGRADGRLCTQVGRARFAARLAWQAAPKSVCAALGLAISAGVLPVIAAWCMKLLLDTLAAGAAVPWTQVWPVAAGLAVSGLAMAVQNDLDEYAHAQMRRNVRIHTQNELYRAISGYPDLRPFEDPAQLDRLRLAEEAGERVPDELFVNGISVVRSALLIGGFAATLVLVWPVMLVAVAATVAPAVALQMTLSRRRVELAEANTPLLRRRMFFSGLMTDARAAKEARLFGIGDYLRERMMRELRIAADRETGLARRALAVHARIDLLGAAVTVLALGFAVTQAARGRLSVGDVSVFLAATAGAYGALISMVGGIAGVSEGLRLFGHYLVVRSSPTGPSTGARVGPLRTGIEFRDVWFRYHDDGPWVLAGLSFTIAHGATVGLVGLNGAGKSTVVKLLCRLYEPQRGTILWDGVPIARCDPVSLRSRISAVFQDFMAYDLTALENIALGRLAAAADPTAINRAARQAGIHDTLARLPDGYATLLSREFTTDGQDGPGVLLSGGQWQRLALARAFLRADADLLILDEVSSGLDAEAERAVHRRLARLRAGRTTLLVSHRLGTLRAADLIVVLDGGRMAECGRHEDLISRGGRYARLFALQAEHYREPMGQPAA